MARFRKQSVEALSKGLNAEQMQAFEHDQGPLCLIAVAGSGKTATVVKAIARRIVQGQASSRILAVTFSKKAAGEMNERLEAIVGKHTECRVGTWHSLALQICKAHNPAWVVDTKNATKILLKEIIGYKQMDWKEADLGKVERFISVCKANAILPTDSVQQFIPVLSVVQIDRYDIHLYIDAYARLQRALKQRNLLTFDDMLVYTWQILSDEKNRLEWSRKWDVLFQDEAQDANLVQCLIAEQLTRDHHNYIAVGDLFQAIYGFRGSKPEYLATFAETAKVITMHRNYRCGQDVINAANVVIGSSKIGSVSASTISAELTHKGTVTHMQSFDLEDEASALVRHAQTVCADGSYGDLTVLYRTNAQSRAMEEALLAAEIPFQIIGGSSFYERKEVRDLLAYLRLVHTRKTLDLFDEESFRRCINTPFRFLGAVFVESAMSYVRDGSDYCEAVSQAASQQRIQSRQRASVAEWQQLIRFLESHLDDSPSSLLQYLVDSTDYIKFLEKQEGAESIDSSHGANVRELIRLATKYKSVSALLKFIEDTQNAAKERNNEEAPNKVTLMTIHRSKGLEFPHVFVSGCNDMILPHAKGDLEEERRLFYVATTRAKKSLVYSSVMQLATRSGTQAVSPSEFLQGIFADS